MNYLLLVRPFFMKITYKSPKHNGLIKFMLIWMKCIVCIALLLLPISGYTATYRMPPSGSDTIGQLQYYDGHAGERLSDIAYRYEVTLYRLKLANPKAPEVLRVNTRLVIPTYYVLPAIRQGIVINMAERRLYAFLPDQGVVMTFPVAMGKPYWRTPTMKSVIIKKKADPSWFVPKSIQKHMLEKHNISLPDVVAPGEDNPLGTHALYTAKSGILLHGTNNPKSIGYLVSSGCIRLYNGDIVQLFDAVAVGTKVTVVHHTYKLGYNEQGLWLEVHPYVDLPEPINDLNYNVFSSIINPYLINPFINWDHVDEALSRPTGVPTLIASIVAEADR